MPSALLPDQLAEQLGRDIVDGVLPPGHSLTLEELEKRHQISRTVAREAVKTLAGMGLVAVRRRVGIVVADPASFDDLNPLLIRWRLAGPGRLEQLGHISELRMGVEPVAARLAASRATPEQVRALADAAIGMTTTGRPGADGTLPDLEAYLAHDVVFHTSILAGSGNPMFGSLAHVVSEVLSGRTHHHLMPTIPNADAIRWHREVADAVATGDGARAEQTMRLIVDEAQTAAVEMAADADD